MSSRDTRMHVTPQSVLRKTPRLSLLFGVAVLTDSDERFVTHGDAGDVLVDEHAAAVLLMPCVPGV